MNGFRSLSHGTWDCKYHLVWIPKYHKKIIYGNLRKYLEDVLKGLALQKESKVFEGHLMGDHALCCCRFSQNMQCLKLLGISKEKVLSTLQGHIQGLKEILLVKVFGSGDIMCPKRVETKKRSGDIYGSKKNLIKKLTN